MSTSDLAKRWREMAAQRAAERAAQTVSVPVRFGGFPGLAHRLDLMSWARAGRLPQYLSKALFATVQGKTTEKRSNDLSPEELVEWLKFQCKAFCSMMDEPRFVESEEAGDNEISYPEFVLMCPEVVREGVQWQLDSCPDIPVQTESGEVSIEDLRSFRDGGVGDALDESGVSRQGIWWPTQPTPRIM